MQDGDVAAAEGKAAEEKAAESESHMPDPKTIRNPEIRAQLERDNLAAAQKAAQLPKRGEAHPREAGQGGVAEPGGTPTGRVAPHYKQKWPNAQPPWGTVDSLGELQCFIKSCPGGYSFR
jgi:hypothetical protein